MTHPVQSDVFAEFQKLEGHTIFRQKNYIISFHKIPKTKYSIGTVLRGPDITQKMLDEITSIAKKENAIFIKLEPDVFKTDKKYNFRNLQTSPKHAFYPFSHIIDLTKTEEELLKAMHPKTRYNIKIAQKHGVIIKEQTTDQGFKIYLKLLLETIKRKGFYLHTKKYHEKLWQLLKETDMVHIFTASYQKKYLAAFMIFTYEGRLFYPYGASSDQNREVMAPTLLMWEIVKYGQKMGLKSFDMWGSLNPDAKPTDRGYGFHRFKQGFGGELKEFVGTYDLIINKNLYCLYNLVDKLRWIILRLKTKIHL